MSSVAVPHAPRPGQDAGVDCRVWPRQSCDLPANCQPVAAYTDKDATWTGKIRDVSQGGMGIVLERRFEPRTMLFIQLPGTERRPLMVRVAHAKRLPEGAWLLGCAFPRQLADYEVEA